MGSISGSDAWKRRLFSVAEEDPDTIASLAEAFVTEVPALCRGLREALEAADAGAAQHQAHSLRSCFRCVEHEGSVERISRRIEAAIGREDFAAALADLPELERAAAAWVRRVRTLRQDASPPRDPQ